MALWAGIVRVSSVGGRAGDRFHADKEQADDIKRAVKAMGDRLHMFPPELDVSGGLPLEKRPSLIQAIEGVEDGRYDGIIVAYLSRLGRNVREQLRAWDRVEAASGKIVVVREGLDTSTPHGRMHRTILLAIAENEREQHTERFAERRRLATAAGIWQCRQFPKGYGKGPDRKLAPNEDADTVRWAFRARIDGTPLTVIADRLHMTTSGARQLLMNRVYLGELHVGEHVNPEAHPALIDEDMWIAAQSKHVPRPGRDREPALLARLVRCSGCSHVMTRSQNGGKLAYSCPTRHSLGRCPAPASIMVPTLDEYVEAVALAHLAKLAATPTKSEDIDVARKAFKDIRHGRDMFLAALDAAGMGVDQAAAAIRGWNERVDVAENHLGGLLARQGAIIGPDILEQWPTWTVRQRNQVLRSLVEGVLVARAGRGARVAVEDRARVIVLGAGVLPAPSRGGGKAMAITPVGLPDLDDPAVLRVPLA